MEKRNKILKIGLTIITILIVAIIGIVIYDRVTVNNKYGINDGSDYMYITFVEWIKKNAEVGEYDYTSISGTVTNGTFTGDWNGEVLTKKDAVASPDSATAK